MFLRSASRYFLPTTVVLLMFASCVDGRPKSDDQRGGPPDIAATEKNNSEGSPRSEKTCADDHADLQQVCISTLPDGVADCADCDLDCVRRMLRVDARKTAKAGTGAQDWPEVTALSCRHSAEAVDAGCCFYAVADGSNTIFVD